MTDTLPPALETEIPGPRSRALALRLEQVESRNVTCLVPEPPIFWERAAGANVWDVDGNRFVDLAGGFGVANVGHAHPAVVRAVAEQAAKLLHAMGDVQPPAVKVELLEALAARYPGGADARAVLGLTGSDAVETAIKTALLATGRAGLVAFEGGYHGLGMGALSATHRPEFRDPFAPRVAGSTVWARYGDVEDVARAARTCAAPVGAVILEPVQGRGGERVPPDGFLRDLRALCDEQGWLLIADEVYTGFGRTGRMFACDHEGVVPDLLCVAKGLASGMPISACIGRREVMDAWPASHGEALQTWTFLGHPPGCAAALASLEVLDREGLVANAAETGAEALAWLRHTCARDPRVAEVRGRGLMIGIAFRSPADAAKTTRAALRAGVIVLPSGADGSVVSVTPALTIGAEILVEALRITLEAAA